MSERRDDHEGAGIPINKRIIKHHDFPGAAAMRRTPRGFSLVELLVVIAVVGILCAILLPAVMAAREASRRIHCLNNLKQVGLALHQYHDAVGSLPMGYVAAPSPDPRETSPGWGWAALILPLLERTSLYGSANFNLPVEAPANQTVRVTALNVYTCPSDRDSGRFTVVRQGGTSIADFYTNSYAACYGAGLEIDEAPDRGNGLFSRNLVVNFAGITDGLATTLAIGERGACLIKTPWAGIPSGGISILSDGSTVGEYGAIGQGAELVLAHANKTNLNGQGTGPDDFYSPHLGGSNFLFADGSVRFVKQTIHLRVYHALCTRDLGEIIEPDSY
jgi:prepilin-type N-terminal cleavage/methylation domain-containing protein/prepilin-type processing-associated H-X9-DG protein